MYENYYEQVLAQRLLSKSRSLRKALFGSLGDIHPRPGVFTWLKTRLWMLWDDRVGPKAPVHTGPHFILVCGGAFKGRGAAVWQPEPTRSRARFRLENRGLPGGGRGCFRRAMFSFHEQRFIGDREGEVLSRAPMQENRFLETPRGKSDIRGQRSDPSPLIRASMG